MNAPVTAHVSSKDRYFSTLPSCIFSVTQQTIKPQRLIIFMDGEHTDLRTNDLWCGIFKILNLQGIDWEVLYMPGKGQVPNHQKAIEMSKTEWIWRLDDDTFAQPNVLEQLLSCDTSEVGAIGGLVINPSFVETLPVNTVATIQGAIALTNVQWYMHNSFEPIEAEHLYSTFLFKKSAASHGYCSELSPVGHREETMFTYEMFRKGWKLIINPKAITWHIRQGQGGIRSYHQNIEYWTHDEEIFKKKLEEWNVPTKDSWTEFIEKNKLIILDNGKGDHIMFKYVLPEIRDKFKNKKIIIAICYPDLFEDEQDIQLISIAEAKKLCESFGKNYEDYNVYKYCIDRNWKEHLIEAFKKLYLED